MGRKKGSKSITPEKRLDWRRRSKQGETIEQIALDEVIEWKTVDRHVKIAISEEELGEERSHVIRDGLRDHFADLLGVVEAMLDGVNSGRKIWFSGETEFLEKALRNHIPRSAIWRLRKKWNAYLEEIRKLKVETEEKLQAELANNPRLVIINQYNKGGLFRGMPAALMSHMEDIIDGGFGLDLRGGFESDSQIDGVPVWGLGSFVFGEFTEEDKNVVETALNKMTSELDAREEFVVLKNLRKKLAETKAKLKEELMVMKWKRIIPGRCRLCPM